MKIGTHGQIVGEPITSVPSKFCDRVTQQHTWPMRVLAKEKQTALKDATDMPLEELLGSSDEKMWRLWKFGSASE